MRSSKVVTKGAWASVNGTLSNPDTCRCHFTSIHHISNIGQSRVIQLTGNSHGKKYASQTNTGIINNTLKHVTLKTIKLCQTREPEKAKLRV